MLWILAGILLFALSTPVFAQEDDDYDWAFVITDDSHRGFAWDIAQPSLTRMAEIQQDLDARLQILRDQHGVDLGYRIYETSRGVENQGQTKWRGLITVGFTYKGDRAFWVLNDIHRRMPPFEAETRSYTYRFKEVEQLTDPDLGIIENIVSTRLETRTMTLPTLKNATFMTHAHCLDMRPVAEATVAQDPDKLVIWSSCHHPMEGLGYILRVHYLEFWED